WSSDVCSSDLASGSSVVFPSAVSNHGCGSRLPSSLLRRTRLLDVVDMLMSKMMGSPSVGIPPAMGLGVYTASSPPYGATDFTLGSLDDSSMMSPSFVTRSG